MTRQRMPLNCSVCGRWVGKDGWEDVSYDMDTGLTDVGYPLCKRCLDERPPTMYDLGMHNLKLGKYKILLADPPYQYDNVATGRNNQSGAARHYDTMPLKDICALPIAKLADKDAALFLWCTTPLLPYGFEILEAWDFKYKTTIYWRKIMSQGLGNWFRGQVEVLLVGVRGRLKPFHCQKANFLQTKVGKHSQKPKEIYGLLESLDLEPKIELFARERRQGWDAWGKELPKSMQTLITERSNK